MVGWLELVSEGLPRPKNFREIFSGLIFPIGEDVISEVANEESDHEGDDELNHFFFSPFCRC